jgi:hypothetical protein
MLAVFMGTAGTEQSILHVRHINNTGVRDMFQSVLQLDNETSDAYLDTIQKESEKHRLLDCSSCKLIGAGSDDTASTIRAENSQMQNN